MLVFFALGNAKALSFALGDAKVPNANGFALQWNIGLRSQNLTILPACVGQDKLRPKAKAFLDFHGQEKTRQMLYSRHFRISFHLLPKNKIRF